MAIGLLLQVGSVSAQNTNAKVSATRHNLSVSGSGSVKATSESQICVFCHTPHAANAAAPGPLWNRTLSSATYTRYTSNSFDSEYISGSISAQPGGSSKLCLSCHDGTLAIGQVTNGPGSGAGSAIAMDNSVTTMPGGGATATGFTRNLGNDLTNDHPISFTFNATLATRDGELRAPPSLATDEKTLVAVRSAGTKPHLPLDHDSHVQCTTCHDPHLDASKFLRLNRLQGSAAPGSTFNPANDQICVACHDKKGWADSVHAVATNAYTLAASTQREFPTGTTVREAGCLNCHDTHTVPGSRRLLREGTDNGASPKQGGGKPAIEETCYQCHSSTSVVTVTSNKPQDIKSDFTGTNKHMPITTTEQAASTEAHEIGGNITIVAGAASVDCTTGDNNCGADFIEAREKLGLNSLTNRHAECTDCHNPHRARRSTLFYGADTAGQATHVPGGTGGNIASGALRGTYGVEPSYTNRSFFDLPTGYTVKRGDPTSTSSAVTSTWVTREYQICLKCHSDFGYDDDNVLPSGLTRPSLGAPGTASPRANFTRYTNQAREFQAPTAHQGNTTTTDSGAGANFSTNNHRSWHPVMDVTGRTAALRGSSSNGSNFVSPWNANVGNQTMHCSDCHGSNTAAGSISPATGKPWGPHGSANDFVLKGIWDTSSGSGQSNTLCFKCHGESNYGGTSGGTGFRGGNKGDLHAYHRDKVGSMRCNWCHVAVPHGWKNKALLVNLNDTGPEVGVAAGTERPNGAFTSGPYYRNAILKIVNFKANGNWQASDCGSRSNSSDRGKEWMITSTCNNPP
jgi:hypothetical protein